jgi:L-threonylcarbamoyladenylate synthase
MVILPVESKNTLEKAVHHLKKGGVIVYPTETSYGIGCIATNVEALEKISVLKGRNEKKVYILLVKNLHMAKKYGIFSKKAEKVAKRYWPGPLTLVLKTKMKYSPTIVSNKNEVALRHSSNIGK